MVFFVRITVESDQMASIEKLSESKKAEILEALGAKPSTSEARGLALMEENDLVIFSPGISTGGFAEINMARENSRRKIIATTIDENGLQYAREVIDAMKINDQIQTRLEDLRDGERYLPESFDFIYARLVLHYLSAQDLDKVLTNFHRILKPQGKLFIVVRSVKNIEEQGVNIFDENTKLTTIPHYNSSGEIASLEIRYFHTPKSIFVHLTRAGFSIKHIEEYQEQLYKDFMRKELAPKFDHLLEVLATKQ